MRVIAGQFRRRPLLAPTGQNTRPTTDRVRESLFQHLELSRLTAGFHALNVLDLFAGSGALAFEALSRGARHATLIDADRDARLCQTKNAQALDCLDRVTIVPGTLPRALQKVRGPFDLIFADPPYDFVIDHELAAAVAEHLAPEGWVVVEHRRDNSPDLGSLARVDIRRYGDTEVSLYHATLLSSST